MPLLPLSSPRPTLSRLALLCLFFGCADHKEAEPSGGDDDSSDTGESSGGEGGGSGDSGSGDSGSDTGDDLDSAVYGPFDTDGVDCELAESGNQRLSYTLADPRTGTASTIDETLPYTFTWACSGSTRSLLGNGVPNHGVDGGNFASQLSEQRVTVSFPLSPDHTGDPVYVGSPGFALNSVKFDPNTAGTCPDDAESDRDCDYGAGSDQWNMVATPGDTSPWRFDFGVDENDAHVQPDGSYHYHGDPIALVEDLNPNPDSSATLVGWMNDGFPIYSLYGASDPDDADSSVMVMQSSYRTIDTVPSDRPSTDDFPLGHFEQDWEYEPGLGDLDACNGRFAATPEFPNGIYHYYTTETYPFIPRCLNGQL